jgi:AcrR family transcriptional regulator
MMKERERNILEAARQVFGDHGFYHTKIQDIADTAGIGKGTVYEYFESKEDLFCRMVRYSLSLYTQRVREGLGTGGCLERLRSLIRVNRQVVANSGPLVDMFLSNGSIGEDKLLRKQIMELFLDVKREMISLVAEALAAGQAESLVRPGIDREFAAELFVYMVMGYCQRSARTGKEEREDALLELFLSGIGD